MALVIKDRVKTTSTTTGTGTFTLSASASLGFQSFSVIGDGNTTYYAIQDSTSGDWEVGIGTVGSSGTTLARTTVLDSSNSGSAVNFGAGTKNVFCTYPAVKAVYLDASGNLTNDITGNAATATKLGTARTISLGSDLSGSVSFDGSSSVTLNATVADDSHNHSTSTLTGLGSLATANSVNASTIDDNSVGAAELNVSGNGTTSQYLRADGDGSFTWATPPDTNTTYSAGTGLSLSGTTFNNTAPDQTVVLTGSGATSISGTYPNFTISSTDTNTTYSAGSGLNLSGTSFSHSDTSSQASVNNSGNTVIQDVTIDTYGHVTGLSSTTLSIPAGGIGDGQSWGSLTFSRGTWYQNTSGKPIQISVSGQNNNYGALSIFDIYVGPSTSSYSIAARFFTANYDNLGGSMTVIVPNNYYYYWNRTSGGNNALSQYTYRLA
jgi:hypothetical protein